MTGSDADVQALLGRSHRLGADRRITNFAGGNTSAKAILADPVTGEPTRVLLVKGSGGDLGTPDRRRPCRARPRPGPGARAPPRGRRARGRPRRALRRMPLRRPVARRRRSTRRCTRSLDVDHVDHTHPDAVIALAAAADGERLVAGLLRRRRRVARLAASGVRARARSCATARRGASSCARGRARRPRAHLLGRDQRRVRGDHARARRTGRAVPRRARSRRAARSPSRRWSTPLADDARRLEAARLGPVARGLASHGSRPVVGHFDDSAGRPRVPRPVKPRPRLAQLGTSCPDHFLTTKVRPLLLDLPPGRAVRGARRPAARAARAVPRRLRARTTTRTRRPSRRRSAATTR